MNPRQQSRATFPNQRETITRNTTSIKQQRSRENNDGFQIIYNDEIINDDQEKRSPTQNQLSLRRSLLRQRQLWENVESTPFQLVAVSDQYYGDKVSRQTLSFLDKMRNFLVKEEQILNNRRRYLIQKAHESISERFYQLKQSLINIVDIWCQKKQMQELDYYTNVSEMSINGSLIQLLSKTERRRQQIDLKMEELRLGLNQFKKGHKQSQLYHNRNIKNTVRDVLGSDYELQVKKLREEVEIIIQQKLPVIPYSDSYAEKEVKLLLRSLESELINTEIYKSTKKQGFFNKTQTFYTFPKSQLQEHRQRQVKQSYRMSDIRQKVLQQLLDKKKRQLDIQTQKFYNSIIKPTRQ